MPGQNLSSAEVKQITTKYTYGTWRRQKGWNPVHVVDAEDCHFTDADGKKYLDFSAQLMCVTLGHKNKAVIQAIQDQARDLAYVGPGWATTIRAELAKRLVEVLPKGLTKIFLRPRGRRRTKQRSRSRGCRRVRRNHFALSVISRLDDGVDCGDGRSATVGDGAGGKILGVIFAPEVNCYKCPILHTYPGCGIACVEYIEHMIANESDVAAVILEPVVGTNGVLIPPKEYLPRLRQICDKHGVLMIADEVMTGWCRTGKWFAVDNWGVVPDILTTAKGITNAAIPLGLCATSEKVASYFEDHFFSHGHTYEAHPLTLAPAIASIDEMKRLNLAARAVELGAYIRPKLEALKDKHPSIGEVRGIGMFWGGGVSEEPENEGRIQYDGGQSVGDAAVSG